MSRHPLRDWRLPLRIAARDARRSKSRSILVLVMIALPVMAVSVADTLYSTADVSGVEGLDRRLGTAAASVEVTNLGGPIAQGFDPDSNSGYPQPTENDKDALVKDLSGIRAVLGESRPAVRVRYGIVEFRSDAGIAVSDAIETDLRSPLLRGTFTLTDGRFPRNPREVLVNSAVTERGPGLGEQLEVGEVSWDIVGIAESTSQRSYEQVLAPVGAFSTRGDDGTANTSALQTYGGKRFLVGGGPVSWKQVQALNAVGVAVTSREVISNPPPTSELPEQIRAFASSVDSATVTVLVLLVVMVLIEVVLLAGPAFAVGARRQTRTLALIGAAGGSPSVSRRVILSSGIVLGTVGGIVGVVWGIVGAWALMPAFQGLSSQRFGPFDVSWTHLLGVGIFGLASALLAAAVPAWIASRQDVVAVLGGRRGDTRASRRSPLLGAVLIGAGTAGAAYGARADSGGEILVALSAILSVLGMIFLVPMVVLGVSKAARAMPLAMRFAARDAARHRTRTVPAVAAVAATVAGVVALGIATTSDEEQNRGEYQPRLAMGQGAVEVYGQDPDWSGVQDAVQQRLPDASVVPLKGVSSELDNGDYLWVEVKVPGGASTEPLLHEYGGYSGGAFLVSDQSLPTGAASVSATDAAAAASRLGEGGVVVFTDSPVRAGRARVVVRVEGDQGGPMVAARGTFPAVYVTVAEGPTEVPFVASPSVAKALDQTPTTLSLRITGDIDGAAEKALTESVAAITPASSVYVERGYQAPESVIVVQLILAGLGAVLMLGGTLTATFLALSDARPDLATLSAVGASPRTRRGVAAGYALVVGFVGALLGALVGFIPGVAISYPLTVPYSQGGASHYLDVPWLLVIGVVLGLPLFTSAVVWLTARSRLPLVARLD